MAASDSHDWAMASRCSLEAGDSFDISRRTNEALPASATARLREIPLSLEPPLEPGSASRPQ